MDVTTMTLNAYLDEWLVLARTRVTPTTYRSYVYRCRTYLRPKLGDYLVGELTIPQLNRHFIWLLHHDGRHGGPLKHTMVAAIHIVLRKALADAVRTGRLADNVAARLTLPRHNPDGDLEPDTLHTWDAAQAAIELLIGYGAWLCHPGFVDNYIATGPGLTNPAPMAWVTWPAAITALDAATLPCSSSEAQMLRVAASLAVGLPLDLGDAVTGLDTANLDLVVQAILHAGTH